MIAGASDGLDGLLARYFKWTSKFGAVLDPIADKLLMLVSYSLLTAQGVLPLWLLVVVVGRDVLIVSGAYTYHYFIGITKMQPTILSKVNTLFQILLVTMVMFSLVFTFIPDVIRIWLIAIVATTSIGSGLQYIWMGVTSTRKVLANKERQSKNGQVKNDGSK